MTAVIVPPLPIILPFSGTHPHSLHLIVLLSTRTLSCLSEKPPWCLVAVPLLLFSIYEPPNIIFQQSVHCVLIRSTEFGNVSRVTFRM